MRRKRKGIHKLAFLVANLISQIGCNSVIYCPQGILHQSSINENCKETKEENTSTWKLYKSLLTCPTILLILLSHFLINLGMCSYSVLSPDRATQFGGLTMVCIRKSNLSLCPQLPRSRAVGCWASLGSQTCLAGSSLDRSLIGENNENNKHLFEIVEIQCYMIIVFLPYRFSPWTLQLTSFILLVNAVTVLTLDFVTGYLPILFVSQHPPIFFTNFENFSFSSSSFVL